MSFFSDSFVESKTLIEINKQQELLNQIKHSKGYNILKTQELIQSISSLANTDHEYSWYFENNQLINLFLLDCFETIINSFFVLDQKDSKDGIKLVSSLISRTLVSENKYDCYAFKHDWLTHNYRAFFINILPMFQYSLDKYKINQDTELIESILILIYYITVAFPLNQLIKANFISELTKFLIKYTCKSPIVPLKIIKILLNDRHVIFCSMNRVEQYYFFRSISKCLSELLDFKRIIESCHRNGLMKKINIAESLDDFHISLFKLIAIFSDYISRYISVHKEPKAILLLNDLLEKVNFILSRLPIINLLELIQQDDFIPNLTEFLKIITCYDLSFVLPASKVTQQRKLFVSIIRAIITALKRTGSIPINGNKKFDEESVDEKLVLVEKLVDKLEKALDEAIDQSPAGLFRASVEHVLNLFEIQLWFIQIKIDADLNKKQNDILKRFDLLYNSLEKFGDCVAKIYTQ